MIWWLLAYPIGMVITASLWYVYEEDPLESMYLAIVWPFLLASAICLLPGWLILQWRDR